MGCGPPLAAWCALLIVKNLLMCLDTFIALSEKKKFEKQWIYNIFPNKDDVASLRLTSKALKVTWQVFGDVNLYNGWIPTKAIEVGLVGGIRWIHVYCFIKLFSF